MIHVYLYFVVQALVAVHACVRGGAPERILAATITLGGILTALFPNVAFQGVGSANLLIDVACFVVMVMVALFADRYWPIWMASVQLLALWVHAIRAVSPDLLPIIYAWASGKLVYPMLALLVIGVARHRDRKLAGLPETAWSLQGRSRERSIL